MNVEGKSADAVGHSRPGGSDNFGKPSKRGIRHAIGRETYLFQVDLFLDGRVPGRQRKRILTDLRNSIDADTESLSLKTVLTGLGKPRDLTSSCAEGTDKSRPLWTVGAVSALGTLMIYWIFLFTYAVGMLAVTMQVGGEFHSHFFFLNVMTFSGDDGVGVGWSGNAALWFPLVLAAVAFISVARVWRVFRPRQA